MTYSNIILQKRIQNQSLNLNILCRKMNSQLSKSKQHKILKLWEGLGYYRRAKNLIKTAKILVNKNDHIFVNKSFYSNLDYITKNIIDNY